MMSDTKPFPSSPSTTPGSLRRGIGKITSVEGGGEYKVTEQRVDASGSWTDAPTPMGLDNVPARDYQLREHGQEDQLVQFWEHRKLGGAREVIIDVGDYRTMVSDNDSTPRYLSNKLIGDDGTGDYLKVSLVEQNDGGDEKLKIQIDKDDLPGATPGGFPLSVMHRMVVPPGDTGGTMTISPYDWRGRLLMCYLQCIFTSTPEEVQWGGGTVTAMVRYFGSNYSGGDQTLIIASDGPAVRLESGTGALFWAWTGNSSNDPMHAICMVQATDLI